MSRIAYVNGRYLPHHQASVHIEDRGYQFADGVYEVFAVLDSKIVDYEGHIKRLYRSLKELNIASPIQRKSYKFHINEIIKRNIIQNGLVYLQVTRGVASRDFKFPKNSKSAIVIIAAFHLFSPTDRTTVVPTAPSMEVPISKEEIETSFILAV